MPGYELDRGNVVSNLVRQDMQFGAGVGVIDVDC